MTRMADHPVRITIDRLLPEPVLLAFAAARAEDMARRARTTYGHATVDGSLVGAYGENAVEVWLTGLGLDVEPLYRAQAEEADLRVAGTGMQLEVKASRIGWWKRHGAVLSGIQVGNILRQDGLVWCVVGPEVPTNAVWIVGWVNGEDLGARLMPVVLKTGEVSFKVSLLDDPVILPDWMDGHRHRFAQRDRFAMTAPSAPYLTCEAGHNGPIGACLICWWTGLGGPERLYAVNRKVHVRGCRHVPDPPPWFTDPTALLDARVCLECLPGVLPDP